MAYEDIIYEERDNTAYITFNRPERMNAFRMETYFEVLEALQDAGWNPDIGSIVLTGAGGKAFCTGGDQVGNRKSERNKRGIIGVPVEEIHACLREIPKPVIAKVRGFAIGGGNVMCTLCDLTIASDNAIFGQVGPKVGSVDPGFGTAFLAHVVGEKKAREMWYLCRRYSAEEALQMGLGNAVYPDDELDEKVDEWCAEINLKSPTAIAIAKRSFNADTEHIRGIGMLGFQALKQYYATDESKEGGNAFREKRPPEFRKLVPRGRG